MYPTNLQCGTHVAAEETTSPSTNAQHMKRHRHTPSHPRTRASFTALRPEQNPRPTPDSRLTLAGHSITVLYCTQYVTENISERRGKKGSVPTATHGGRLGLSLVLVSLSRSQSLLYRIHQRITHTSSFSTQDLSVERDTGTIRRIETWNFRVHS